MKRSLVTTKHILEITALFTVLMIGSVMTAQAQQCTSDADCLDPNFPQCNLTTNICQALPGACQSDADCLDLNLPFCNTSNGACQATPPPVYSGNLLFNARFNRVGPEGPLVVKNIPGNGVTAARRWWALATGSIINNTPGITTTELLPSTIVSGGTMLHVITDTDKNGLVQVFGAIDTGPETAYACLWIYLVSGSVGIGIGNGGNTNGNDVVLNKTGSWEVLQVSNAHSPVNEIVIASLGGGAEFYVENARVSVNRRNCKPR